MAENSTLIAWIEYRSRGVDAVFRAKHIDRPPARRWFPDQKAAQAWVENEAETFGACVEWVKWC